MRHSVTTPLYRARKAIDGFLSRLTPFTSFDTIAPTLSDTTFDPLPMMAGWIPLYTMVTFRPDISYASVRRKAERQDRTMNILTGIISSGVIVYLLQGWFTIRRP